MCDGCELRGNSEREQIHFKEIAFRSCAEALLDPIISRFWPPWEGSGTDTTWTLWSICMWLCVDKRKEYNICKDCFFLINSLLR